MTPLENRPVVLLGAGGNARVLVSMLRAQGIAIHGCAAPRPPAEELAQAGIAYLGRDEDLTDLDPEELVLVNGLGSAGPVSLRRAVFETWTARGFAFRGLRHDSAIIDPAAALHPSVTLMAGSIVQAHARLEANVLVNTGAIVEHDCRIGAHSHVATGARLAGEVTLGPSCHVGAGATIIQQVAVGAGATIAAGTCVIRDVADGATVAGVPARPLSPRENGAEV